MKSHLVVQARLLVALLQTPLVAFGVVTLLAAGIVPGFYSKFVPHPYAHGTVQETSEASYDTVVKLDDGSYLSIGELEAEVGERVPVYRSAWDGVDDDPSRVEAVAATTTLMGFAGVIIALILSAAGETLLPRVDRHLRRLHEQLAQDTST